jgi:hypothetical protein
MVRNDAGVVSSVIGERDRSYTSVLMGSTMPMREVVDATAVMALGTCVVCVGLDDDEIHVK